MDKDIQPSLPYNYNSYEFKRAVRNAVGTVGAVTPAQQVWTPTVTQGAIAVTLIAGSSNAWYLDIGSAILFWASISINGGGAAGEILIFPPSPPFIGLTTAQSLAVGSFYLRDNTAPNTRMAGTVCKQATLDVIECQEDGLTGNFWATQMANGDQFTFWGVYPKA